MGFCFNTQLRLLHTVKDSVKHNKSKQSRQTRLIRNPVIRSKRPHQQQQQQQQLSREDYSFLRSIGLKIRKSRK